MGVAVRLPRREISVADQGAKEERRRGWGTVFSIITIYSNGPWKLRVVTLVHGVQQAGALHRRISSSCQACLTTAHCSPIWTERVAPLQWPSGGWGGLLPAGQVVNATQSRTSGTWILAQGTLRDTKCIECASSRRRGRTGVEQALGCPQRPTLGRSPWSYTVPQSRPGSPRLVLGLDDLPSALHQPFPTLLFSCSFPSKRPQGYCHHAVPMNAVVRSLLSY